MKKSMKKQNQLSHSCMSSMSSVIKQHNYKELSRTENVD